MANINTNYLRNLSKYKGEISDDKQGRRDLIIKRIIGAFVYGVNWLNSVSVAYMAFCISTKRRFTLNRADDARLDVGSAGLALV